MRKSILLFLLIFTYIVNGQNRRKIDSLQKVIPIQQDTHQLKSLILLSIEYMRSDLDSVILMASQISKESEKIGWLKGLGDASHLTAQAYHAKNMYNKALAAWEKTIEIRKKANNKKDEAKVYNNIGIIYLKFGDYTKALEYYFKGLKMKEELGVKKISIEYANIGKVYVKLKQYDKAIEYYLKSIQIYESFGDYESAAIIRGWVGEIYANLGNYELAREYGEKSVQKLDSFGNKNDITEVLANLGEVYGKSGDNNKALAYHLRSLRLNEETENRTAQIRDLANIADIYSQQKKYRESEKLLLRAESLANSLRILEYRHSLQASLSSLYHSMGEYKKAYEHAHLYAVLKDSLINSDKSQEIGRLEAKSEFDRQKAIEDAEQKKEKEKQEALALEEKRRNRLVNGIAGLIALSVGIIALIIFRSLRTEKKQKEIIENQKNLVEEKQKEIVDSINYAKRIQEAVLPVKELKHKVFPDSFILFQPKDIVSGDFYWFTEKNGKRLIAAADCTGHGVPGAFMSLIGNTFLNEIVNVKGITRPAEILNQLRDQIISSLKQTGTTGENKDGMDIAILCFDDNNNLEFAGANNPLWHIRNGECIEYKSNKQPVGYYTGERIPFTSHTIKAEKDDVFYIFTDGYADQFGGEKGKKFKYKNLRDILLNIHRQPMPEQEEFLLNSFSDWKKELEQIDDVCIIGVRTSKL